MILGTMEVELRLDGCFNLKEKRRVLQSLIQRLRGEMHLSVAETGDHDLWNSALVGIACVTTDAAIADSVLDRALRHFDENAEIEVVGVDREVLRT